MPAQWYGDDRWRSTSQHSHQDNTYEGWQSTDPDDEQQPWHHTGWWSENNRQQSWVGTNDAATNDAAGESVARDRNQDAIFWRNHCQDTRDVRRNRTPGPPPPEPAGEEDPLQASDPWHNGQTTNATTNPAGQNSMPDSRSSTMASGTLSREEQYRLNVQQFATEVAELVGQTQVEYAGQTAVAEGVGQTAVAEGRTDSFEPPYPYYAKPSEIFVFAPVHSLPSSNRFWPATPSSAGYDLKYFKSLRNNNDGDGYKKHSAALKWHRTESERLEVSYMDLDNEKGNPIGKMIKGKKTSWSWETGGATVHWCWQELVADMNETSMELVLKGLDASSDIGALVSCRLVEIEDPDHKRHNAAFQEQKDENELAEKEKRQPREIPQGPQNRADNRDRWRIWNFEFTCQNGKVFNLHPNYSSTKIDVRPPPDYAVPPNGLGSSNRGGTFQKLLAKNRTPGIDLRFRPGQRPQPVAEQLPEPALRTKAPPPSKALQTPASSSNSGDPPPKPKAPMPGSISFYPVQEPMRPPPPPVQLPSTVPGPPPPPVQRSPKVPGPPPPPPSSQTVLPPAPAAQPASKPQPTSVPPESTVARPPSPQPPLQAASPHQVEHEMPCVAASVNVSRTVRFMVDKSD